MLRKIVADAVLLSTAVLLSAQSTTRPEYMERAVIRQDGSRVTVIANDPVPLFQAVVAIRQEYGLRVNWEAAPGYSHFDVVDDTGPKWRAAHPEARGVTRPAGGLFTSTFLQPNDPLAAGIRGDVLATVIRDYNATENPGKYALRAGADGSFAVVGTKIRDEAGGWQEVRPIFDTPLTLEKQSRNLYEAVSSILAALSATSGKRVILMGMPNNLFRDAQVTVGGPNVTARDLLQQAFAGARRPLEYDLGFDPDFSPVYVLNVSIATRTEVDSTGKRRLVPIDRPH
jgi:hypothetical protein